MRGVLLDIAGVLLEGGRTLPGATDAMARLRKGGVPVRFLTNSTRKPRRVLVNALASHGIAVETQELFTPAAAARDWLERFNYQPHLVIHPALAEDFEGCAGNVPIAVVVGDAGPFFAFDMLNDAFRHLIAGAPFLALAANRVFRDDDGELSMDAGAFVHALEFSSNVAPLVLGKPSPDFFAAACASMDCPPHAAVMIGDDCETDIAGALDAGVGQAVLVRTGKYAPGDETRMSPPPTATADGIAEAVDLLLDGGL